MKPISAFLGTLAILSTASAQSTWSPTSGTNWSTDANWNPSAPAEGGNIIIADTTPGNLLTLDDGSRTIGSLTFPDSRTTTPTFNIRTGTNTLTLNGGLIANGNFTAGNVLNIGGNIAIAANQDWTVAGEIGSVTLDRGAVISNGGSGIGTLALDGNLTKKGNGQLSLVATTVSGAGNFIVDQGALKLNAGSSSLLTVGGTGNITVNDGASLFISRNSGTMNITRDIVMNGASTLVLSGGGTNASTVASPIAWHGAGTLNLPSANNPYTLTGAWSGSGSVSKTGTGTLTLSGNSSFSGTFTNTLGVVLITHNNAFGTGDVVVNGSGGTTRVDLEGVTVSNNFLINSTATTGFLGPLTAVGGSLSVVNGDVTIAANVGNGGHLASTGAGSVLRINGAINSLNGVTPNARIGTIEVGGGGNYTNFNVGEGTLRLVATNGVNPAAHLNLASSAAATFDLNGHNQTLSRLTRGGSFSSAVTNAAETPSVLTIDNTVDHTYTGNFSNGAGGLSLIKEGTGSFTLSGTANAAFTGHIAVNEGTLVVNTTIGSPVTVDGGTLSGPGSIGGPVSIGAGALAPGLSPGTLTISNVLTLSPDSLLLWEIDAGDTTAGLGINDLVTGMTGMTLDGTLHVTGAGDFTTVAEGTAWRLFEYSGTLDNQGLVLGSMPTLASGLQWIVDTGTGGQVNLLVAAIPEPAAAFLGSLGSLILLRRRRG